jgi:hypothetical protein
VPDFAFDNKKALVNQRASFYNCARFDGTCRYLCRLLAAIANLSLSVAISLKKAACKRCAVQP